MPGRRPRRHRDCGTAAGPGSDPAACLKCDSHIVLSLSSPWQALLLSHGSLTRRVKSLSRLRPPGLAPADRAESDTGNGADASRTRTLTRTESGPPAAPAAAAAAAAQPASGRLRVSLRRPGPARAPCHRDGGAQAQWP